MEVKLLVVGGDAKTSEITLKLPTIIGRGRGATLLLPHPLVSRQHCEIYESDGVLHVRDMGSLNGTFVGNEPISEAPLPPGELLTVGAVTFRAVYGELLERLAKDKEKDQERDKPRSPRVKPGQQTTTVRDRAVETVARPNSKPNDEKPDSAAPTPRTGTEFKLPSAAPQQVEETVWAPTGKPSKTPPEQSAIDEIAEIVETPDDPTREEPSVTIEFEEDAIIVDSPDSDESGLAVDSAEIADEPRKEGSTSDTDVPLPIEVQRDTAVEANGRASGSHPAAGRPSPNGTGKPHQQNDDDELESFLRSLK